MPTPAPPSPPRNHRAFLLSRWPARARLLAAYALGGSLAFLLLDVVFTRFLAAPPDLATVAAVRLPWMAGPIAGWALVRARPRSAVVPGLVVAISVAWTWGNDWAYFALGLAGSVLQTVGVVLCFITAATFMPVGLRGRLGVFGLMGAGHVALDLAWPQSRSVAERLWADAAILALVVCETVLFEQFANARRRGFVLRRVLERKVRALEASRRRADAAAAEVGRLAAHVAHEVNNPLAAVKVNVRWLAEAQADTPSGERAEVVAESLDAIERIARSVSELRREATAAQKLPEGPRRQT